MDAQDEAVRRYALTPQSEIVNEALQGGGVNGCGQEAPTTTSHVSGNENINQQSHITNGKWVVDIVCVRLRVWMGIDSDRR